MDFKGLINLTRKDIAYNFQTTIDYANLNQLNFVKKDSIAIFKGKADINILGNNLDDLKGDVHFEHTSYQNSKNNYYFEESCSLLNFNSDWSFSSSLGRIFDQT
jgi:hypothetical protein